MAAAISEARSLAKIIDGRHIANGLLAKMREDIQRIMERKERIPKLAVVLVGSDPASHLYVENKTRACHSVGILTAQHVLRPDRASPERLKDVIRRLNDDPSVDGILLQLPLPQGFDPFEMMSLVDVAKDVDGFHPQNLGCLVARRPFLSPCTPAGVVKLIESTDPSNPSLFKGKNCVLVGASQIVGLPMALELLSRDATVTITHKETVDLGNAVRGADILVVAAGVPRLIPGEWIKRGATVIDVGINRVAVREHGRRGIVGDVDFPSCRERAAFISPVPGGVGPMTVAMLLCNTLKAYYARTGIVPLI